MSKILEGLLEYLEQTSKEQMDADWAEFAHFDKVGPQVDDYISRSQNYEMDYRNPWDVKIPETIQNPEFTSDFFLTKCFCFV